MSQKSSASLPGICVLAFLLGPPAFAQVEDDPLPEVTPMELGRGDTRPGVQLIGWSADEQRYAFRVITHHEEDLEMAEPAVVQALEQVAKDNAGQQDADGFCKGYLDHQGKRFKGALQLLVFEGEQRLASLPIQDEPRCTPPQVAAERLAEAKKKLAELGIDLTRTGRELPLVPRKRLTITPANQPPYELEYVSKLKDSMPPHEKFTELPFWLRGPLELYMYRGGKKQTIFTRKVDTHYSKFMGGLAEEGLTSAHVAPSGQRGVVLGSVMRGSGRGGFTTVLRVATVWGWPEGTPAQGK